VNAEYLDTLNDREYMRFSRNSGKIHTIESQTLFITSFTTSEDFLYGACIVSTGEFFGTCSGRVDHSRREVTLGVLIFKAFSGRGLGKEMTLNLVNLFKKTHPNYKLVIGTHIENKKMQAIARKLGFIEDVKRLNAVGKNIYFILN
jgi:RimJ/RimL family protein N-acetyltransferase